MPFALSLEIMPCLPQSCIWSDYSLTLSCWIVQFFSWIFFCICCCFISKPANWFRISLSLTADLDTCRPKSFSLALISALRSVTCRLSSQISLCLPELTCRCLSPTTASARIRLLPPNDPYLVVLNPKLVNHLIQIPPPANLASLAPGTCP